MHLRRRIFIFAFLTVSILTANFMLEGCMVGPDFHSPAAPLLPRYTGHPMPEKTVSIKSMGKRVGKAQHFIMGADIPDAWWYLFHSHELNDLIMMALANNPNLAAAKAALVQAQQLYNAQIGSTMLPLLTSDLYFERQRFQGSSFGLPNTPGNVFNLYNASLAISYTLDIWGGLRRQIENMGAQVDYQQFELEAAFLTLTSNVVTTAFTIASYREQIKVTHELIRLQERQLAIITKQFRLGGASKVNVLEQQTLLEQTRATLLPLEQNLARNLHALSVLIGQYPSENALPRLTFDKFDLPKNLPISIPSRLVRQRPDIRASEALLHASSALVGVATANLLPQLTITGTYGFQSEFFNRLFSSSSKYWTIITSLTQTIFNGGALIAQRKASIAAFQQAAANYRQTVLTAFQNVADTLKALQHDALSLRALRLAEISAYQSLQLNQKQFRLGGVSYLNLLVAQIQYQQTKISRVQAQAARYTDTAALFQALGGGWWNRCPIDCDFSLSENLSQYDPDCFR